MNAYIHQNHRRFPEWLAFTLDNRIRRLLEPPHQLVSKLVVRPSDVVMDFGCGPGFYTIPLARIAARTIAADVSSGMLEKTASKARKAGVTVELMKTDGAEVKLGDESIDLILLHHVFHEVTDKTRVLSEFHRILKPSGRLAVVERTRAGLLGGRFGPPVIDQREVTEEMQLAGFGIVRAIEHSNDSILICQKH